MQNLEKILWSVNEFTRTQYFNLLQFQEFKECVFFSKKSIESNQKTNTF